jgi:hypothetical protein
VPKPEAPHLPPEAVRRVLRKEFTTFFIRMRTAEAGWIAVPDQTMIDAVADALVAVAQADGRSPVAYLQTLVHELQDRVNTLTTKA